jgi:pimeloyl-ACP methyl ester carboxylesterase
MSKMLVVICVHTILRRRGLLMPYAKNALDGGRIYFEDDGGEGVPVVMYGGLLDSVVTVRDSQISRGLPADEFRLIYGDHRGLGRSDKPHQVDAYAMPLRVADAVSILDDLAIERAHFIGASYGGRFGFGIGEHAPGRVLSLVLGGQQPYAIDPEGPLARVIPRATAQSAREGSLEPFVSALETVSGTSFPPNLRNHYLDNDPQAIDAASTEMMSEGDISEDLGAWNVKCLIYAAAGDADFYRQASRAADEIPNAEFVSVGERDHIAAHLQQDPVLSAVLRTLRE